MFVDTNSIPLSVIAFSEAALMLNPICRIFVIAAMLMSFGSMAAGEPRCGLYACATFSINTYGITEVYFTSKVSQELVCWVKVQDAPVRFMLQKKSRIFSAGYGFSWVQYSWRCDVA
jgi:hypothetical protein